MSLQEFVVRHGYVAIFIVIMLEEMGIPMPVPTDVVVIIVGYQLHVGALNPLLAFLVLLVASSIGASVMYLAVRQGGRPLIERFGRYIHLKPEHLDRSEQWIARRGWLGIAIGRFVPGIRSATVISCGLFGVPYWRFLSAHLAGTSLNIICFLALGWIFGPSVVEYFHLPQIWLRALVLLIVAIGLPALIFWLYRRSGGRAAAESMPAPSRRRALTADVLMGFVGAIEVTSAWSAVTIVVAELSGAPRLSAAMALRQWLQGRGVVPGLAYALIYLLLALLCVVISVLYHELPLERRLPHVGRVAVLAVAAQLLVALGLTLTLLVKPPPPLLDWWQANAIVTVLSIIFGMIGYAVIAVYGRILAVRALPARPWGRAVAQSQAAAVPQPPEMSETIEKS